MNTSPQSLTAYAWLSLGAAVATIGLKTYAWWLTDSMGLLSDALESLINLVAAIIMLAVLGISSQPPDDDHAYGHEKIEYFSSGAEGIMIMLAAFSIALTAWERLWHPMPLQALDIGIAVSIVASMINLVVAQILIRVGKKRHSITLEADGKHLMTDVWPSRSLPSEFRTGQTSWLRQLVHHRPCDRTVGCSPYYLGGNSFVKKNGFWSARCCFTR